METQSGEPLTISSAIDASTGEPIAELTIEAVSDRWNEWEPTEDLVITDASGLTIVDDRVICTIPCSPVSTAGSYSFTVSAPGYQATTVTLDAVYQDYEGGCPSHASGAALASVELTPE